MQHDKFLKSAPIHSVGSEKGKNKASKRTRSLVFIALSAALTAALSQIAIPLPTGIPLTLQTFAVAFAAYLLGVKGGVAAVGLYILMGAVGAPVFANFTGGLGKLLGVTGGFIWGFPAFAFIAALPNKKGNAVLSALFGTAGLLLCHAMGIAQYSLAAQVDFSKAALTVSAPFLLKDVLSVLLAYAAAKAVKSRNKGFIWSI